MFEKIFNKLKKPKLYKDYYLVDKIDPPQKMPLLREETIELSLNEMDKEAYQALTNRRQDPVMLGKFLSDTEVVIKLANMPEYAYLSAVKFGQVAFLDKMFGFKPRTLASRVRKYKKLLVEEDSII